MVPPRPQSCVRQSGCSAGSRTQALTAFTIHFFLFFFQVTGLPRPSVPCAGHQRPPGHQRAVASRPARRLPPRLGSHAPSAHSPGGPRRQGQRSPAPLPRPAQAPLQPRAALWRRGAQRRRGPRAAECELAVDSGPLAAEPEGVWQRGGTSVHGRQAAGLSEPTGPHCHSPSTQHPMAGAGGDSALALARLETAPFRDITFSPWTLQMLPLRAFKDLGIGRVSWVISPWAQSVTRGSL